MSFLRNGAINRVNLHSAVQALAHGAGEVFVLVFLIRAGLSIPAALLVQTAIVAGRFVLRPLVLPLAVRFGLKPLLIAGTLGKAAQYLVLSQVDGVGAALVFRCLITMTAEILYYPAYNAAYSALGDSEHRGHQVGAREALIALANTASPLLGPWGLMTAGGLATFAFVAAIQALAVIPLLGLPNIPVAATAPGAWTSARYGTLLIAADGWFDAVHDFVWQIALFTALKESLPAYGGAMALAGLAAGTASLFLGRLVDRGMGRRVVLLAYGVAIAVILLRAASLGSPWLAAAGAALGAAVIPLLVPPLCTATYNLAQASPCPYRFQLSTEAGWDVGCIGACLSAAALIALGGPLSGALLLGLPAAVAGCLLLGRYFSRTG